MGFFFSLKNFRPPNGNPDPPPFSLNYSQNGPNPKRPRTKRPKSEMAQSKMAQLFLQSPTRRPKGVGEGGAAGACAPALSKVGGAQVGLSPPTFDRPSVLI